MSRSETRSRIVEVLGESVYHVLGLKESLSEERAALEAQDLDALNAAVSSKSRCIEKLRELEDRRGELCRAAGFGAGPVQMSELAQWCDEDAVIDRCWAQLMEAAADCNAMNLTNGAIIQMRRQQFDTGLAVLRGTRPESETYGRHGTDAARMSRRSLAEA